MAISASSWQGDMPIGMPGSLTDVDTTQKWPLGKTIEAKDIGSTNRGFGVFRYVKGVASTVAGDALLIHQDYTTSRAVARDKGAIGIALAPIVASTYGWVQVQGQAVVNVTGASADSPAFLTSTAGSLSTTAVAGDCVIGARAGAVDTGLSVVNLGVPAATADFDNA